MVQQERPAASMVAVTPFDRKAEIEECAALSAVNFYILSSCEMLERLVLVQSVTDFTPFMNFRTI